MTWGLSRMELEDYKYRRLDLPTARTWTAYYTGFGKHEEKPMLEEEMKDLERIYTESLHSIREDIECTLGPLLNYMRGFIEMNEKKDATHEKLVMLRAKMGLFEQREEQ